MDRSKPLSSDPNDFCFLDTETRSRVNVKVGGMYQHTEQCRVLIVTYAIGDGPVRRWVNENWHVGMQLLSWGDAPADLLAFAHRACAGAAWFVAWNAAFDRHALWWGTVGDIVLAHALWQPTAWIDAMTQATRSHLPPDLKGASARSGGAQKGDGRKGIYLFSDEAGAATPETHPQDWADFVDYAADDIASMRDVFWSTMPLTRGEWEEYWASEEVNDRGLPVDRAFVEAASELAEHAAQLASADIARISGGALFSVNQHEAIAAWVADKLAMLPEAERILTREIVEEQEEEGDGVVLLPKLSVERNRVEELLNYLRRVDEEQGLTDEEFAAYELLEVRLYGASATPRKFTKMLPMLGDGDRLRGQYVFSGAPATGRFSSRGLQVHNLTRSTVGERADEIEAIELVQGSGGIGERYKRLKGRFGPVGRTLSRLIRPAIIAPEGQALGWIDWTAIEARVLPWLAGSEGAEEVLEVFRENDRDPSLPDIYRVQAGKILKIDARDVSKPQRQSHGKVPVLSLGFGGAEGALHAMGRNYGVSFTSDEARGIVVDWRDENKWARRFWDKLWEAALYCKDNPGAVMEVGRLVLTFDASYMGGTLFLILPCGRPLLYPALRWEERELKNKLTGALERKVGLTYRRGYGRSGLWYGTLAENATQGFAASLLRRTIWRLEREMPQLVVGHTHDEVILRAPVADIAAVTEVARGVMLDVPDFAAGLPLAAEATVGEFYTKTGE